VEEQSRRLTRSGWQEFLNGLQRSERIGYRYEQNSLAPFNSPLPETQPENTVKTSILVTGTPVGTIQLERSADQPWQSEEVELVNSVVGQASRQLDNLRLLAQAEHYQSQAESAVGRLTREGWKEYLKTKIENSGYLYDQVHVKPLATAGAAEVDGEAAAADHPIETVVQPLRIGAANVGEVAFEGIGALDAASNKLVAEVADVLSGHIEGLRLTEQTQKALIQTEDLYSSSAQVVRSSSIEDVLRAVIETTSLSRFDQGSIIFFDRPWVDKMPETGIVAGTWDRLGREATVPVGTATPLRQTPLAHMIRRDEPVVIPDVLVDLRLDNTFRYQLQSTGRSLVVYPLVAGDTCFGYLSVTASQPVYLAEDEIRPIQTLVSQAATVIQSIRLLQEAQTRAQREQALRQITTAVRSSTNADTILRTATRELGVALGRKVKVQLGGAPKSSEA
jgi:GAF domain-containing protein